MKKQIGINYLHRHPKKEGLLGLDNDHIIVDKKDWEEVVDYINFSCNKSEYRPPILHRVLITQDDFDMLKMIRNYFGENDKSGLERLAYAVLNRVIGNINGVTKSSKSSNGKE